MGGDKVETAGDKGEMTKQRERSKRKCRVQRMCSWCSGKYENGLQAKQVRESGRIARTGLLVRCGKGKTTQRFRGKGQERETEAIGHMRKGCLNPKSVAKDRKPRWPK